MNKIIILLGAAALMLAGCGKEFFGARTGERITFSARTTYKPATKTAYTGTVADGKELIAWVPGDQVRIFSEQAEHRYQADRHEADYLVTAVTNNGHYSNAQVDNPGTAGTSGDRNGLVWGTGRHTFYGIYPSPAVNSDIAFDLATRTATLALPKAQTCTAAEQVLLPDMDYAYMYAGIANVASGSRFTLAFQSMFTAFQFKVKAAVAPVVLKRFRLFSKAKAMTGSCTATVSANADSEASTATYSGFAGNREATLDFGSGIALALNEEITFTVFALPQDFNDLSASFTVTKPDDSIEKTNTLALKYGATPPAGHAAGEFVTFPATLKHRITCNVSPEFTHLIEVNAIQIADWTDQGGTVIDIP